MDEYNLQLRGGFPYGGPLLAASSSVYGRSGGPAHHNHLPISSFHLQSDGQDHAVVKTEGGSHYPNIEDHHAAIKSKIIAHPQYSNLLQAYMDCQKVIN